jgi:hypothetical protein
MRGGESNEVNRETATSLLLNRLQIFTNVCLINEEKGNLSDNIDSGLIQPYYLDNGLLYRFASPNSLSIQRALVEDYILTPPFQGKASWNTHTGIAGWFYLLKQYELPVYILFLSIILLVPYYLVGYIIKDITILPIIHIISVLFVFHGWFVTQVNFIISLMFYSLISRLMLSVHKNK